MNSERGGVNYLLASLPPPAWKPREGANLLRIDSVFHAKRGAFYWFGEVRQHLRDLADFLKADPDPNKPTRDRIATLVQGIAEQLADFGISVRGRYPAGWTRDDACHLLSCEQLWLDPGRKDLDLRNDPEHPNWETDDVAFQRAYDQGDWPDEIAIRFGLWLNGQLRKQAAELVTVAAPEMRHFARQAVLDVAWPIPLRRHAAGGPA